MPAVLFAWYPWTTCATTAVTSTTTKNTVRNRRLGRLMMILHYGQCTRTLRPVEEEWRTLPVKQIRCVTGGLAVAPEINEEFANAGTARPVCNYARTNMAT